MKKGKETTVNVPKPVGQVWRDVQTVEVIFDGTKLTIVPAVA